MLRHKDLCPGANVCPYVRMEDPDPGPDPLPCGECPLIRLSEYLRSPEGQLISVVVDIDFAIQSGLDVPLSSIPYPEFLMLRVLAEERQNWQDEESRRRR